jgi:hypothetical protein
MIADEHLFVAKLELVLELALNRFWNEEIIEYATYPHG